MADPVTLDQQLDLLEGLLEKMEALAEPVRSQVFELLDGVDRLHRMALRQIGVALPPAEIERLRAAHPAITWLWDAYGVGIDGRDAADRALEEIRPYLHSHGGEVEVIDVVGGAVSVRMSGACSGCTASAITLQHGVEQALRDNMPSFVELLVEDDDSAPEHAPPGPTLLQISPHPDSTLARP